MLCMSSLIMVGFQSFKKEKQFEYTVTEDELYGRFDSSFPEHEDEDDKRVQQGYKATYWSQGYGRLVQVVLLPELNEFGKSTARYYWEKEKSITIYVFNSKTQDSGNW